MAIPTHNPEQQTIVISGTLDALSMTRLRHTFDEMAHSLAPHIVVDLSYVDFMDSSGIGALAFLFKRLKGAKRTLAMKGLHGQPEKLVRHLGIDRSIETHFIH